MAEIVRLQTSMGAFDIELYTKHAPKACENFVKLAERGYYDGVLFHRLVRDFILQGGDPTGTGRGGSSIYGESFEDEICSDLAFSGAGIVAMANSGPNSNGSQFFITLAPTNWLQKKHTIFGRVYKGMDVIERISTLPTDSNDRPLSELKILKAHRLNDSYQLIHGN